MKRRVLSALLAAMMLLTMLPAGALAVSDQPDDTVQSEQDLPEVLEETETASTVDADNSAGEEKTEIPTEDDAGSSADEEETPLSQSNDDTEQPTVTASSYEVSTTEELSNALAQIAASESDEAIIVLKADVNAPAESNVASFGADGKHITVCSTEGDLFKLNMASRGILTGSCTFDNVNVTGYKLYCNGFWTIFTENGQIHLTGTLYGGGYKTDVDSTYVVIAATGEINPKATNGLHNVIGGSYQGSVEGDTYLEITGDIKFQSGNHITPGCVMGDGTSGDSKNSPDVYVGGNATLIYDNANNTTSPAIEGTYGCEMKGDVTLDVRSGKANEICGNCEFPEKSIIRGDLHIIAGAEQYENTDRTLRLGGNLPITGAGNLFARAPFNKGNYYTVSGNVTIDTYENVWGWDKNGTIPGDVPEIYGAIESNVGGNITINAHGSHMENITGACDSAVTGSVTINATDVELKNSYYETQYDEGDIYGLYEYNSVSTAGGSVTINVDGGDVGLLLVTDQDSANESSAINVTGKPKIRTGVLGTAARDLADGFPTVNILDCEATIPFVRAASQINITDKSVVTVHEAELNQGLLIEKGSSLTTDDNQIYIWGNVEVNGTWEQKHSQDSNYNDIYVQGTTKIGSDGYLINHGTSNLKGAVTNNGMIALLNSALMQGDYTGTNAEIRLPVVTTNYDGTDNGGDIPLWIKGTASGNTTINTVAADNWQTLQNPTFGENYILSAKIGDAPAQNVFLLGNEDALLHDLFLKRVDDADTTDDTYYMWQVATGIHVEFDKNEGETEASPRIMVQDKVAGAANHFDLPTTNPTRTGYNFAGWNTDKDGSGTAFTAQTDVTESMTVYAQWEPDEAYSLQITPMDLTIYVGGDGCQGVIGEDGKFAIDNDLPEIGFYVTLPDDVNAMLGSTADDPVDLSDKLRLTYDDDNGTTRSWSLELYGDETMSHVTENGRKVYIYKLMSSKIDDTEEKVPARVQFTRADGSVMVDTEFKALLNDQFRNYKISLYPGQLDENLYKATFITTDGQTLTRPIKLETGTLKVRGNTDETYRAIEENTTPSVDPQEKGLMLVGTAQADTQYYINNSGVSADAAGVRLLVDHSLDDALLSAYIDRTSDTNGKYEYQFRYLDLVDTHNGNAFVTLGENQKLNLYWPVPSDAKSDSEFQIIHFKGIDRDSNADINDLLTTRIPEKVDCEKVTIDGQQFIKFTTGSFSPFALLYEKAAPSGGGSSGGGGSSSSSKYTLHYESNGGTSYKDESYSSGTTVTLDKAPARESYTFTGWYADKALTDKISSIKMTSNKTVYAGWTATGVPDMLNGDDHYAYVVGYSDGTVRPNANISRAEVATIFFRLLKEEVRDSNLTTENTFADVTNGRWHNKAISTMAKLGVVKGRSAEVFDPDAPITRAEFATICARFDKTQISTSSNFTDISGHWAEKYIERAATLGWIAGYSDGTFRPNNYITRAEAMTMINRVLRRMPQSADDLLNDMTVWPDNQPTDWHYLAVQEATNSHDFDRKGEVNEKWTKLTTAPDWARYQ